MIQRPSRPQNQARQRWSVWVAQQPRDRIRAIRDNDERAITQALTIPRSIEAPVDDPGHTLEKLNVIPASTFWRWFHLPDKPKPAPSRSKSRYETIWGVPMVEFMLRDEMALVSTVSLVLRKRSLMTGIDGDKLARVAEVQALQLLRKNIEQATPESIDSILLAIVGRCLFAFGDGDYEAVVSHLQAVRILLQSHQPCALIWQLTAFCDLRGACLLSRQPMLDRSVHPIWDVQPQLAVEICQTCKRLAMQCTRTLGSLAGDRLVDFYRIFLLLHEQQAVFEAHPYPDQVPVKSLYYGIHDSCMLGVALQESSSSLPFAQLLELLIISMKLSAWEKGSPYLPRCGDIEFALIQRASQILTDVQSQLVETWSTHANLGSLLWVVFNFTATAYIHGSEEWKGFIPGLRSVCQALRISNAGSIKKHLRIFPSSQWWYSRALQPIWHTMSPAKGQWKVLATEIKTPSRYIGHHLQLMYFDTD